MSSADVLLSEVDRPTRRNGRKLRHNAVTTTDPTTDTTDLERKKRRSRRYESDHSFHIEQATGSRRNVMAESDSEHELIRPTRNSLRQAQMVWGQMTDSLEETPSAEEPTTSRGNRRSTRRRLHVSDSEHSPEETSISKRVPSNRSTRSAHNRSSNEDTSASMRASRTRRQGNFKLVLLTTPFITKILKKFFVQLQLQMKLSQQQCRLGHSESPQEQILAWKL